MTEASSRQLCCARAVMSSVTVAASQFCALLVGTSEGPALKKLRRQGTAPRDSRSTAPPAKRRGDAASGCWL
eukprot:2971826-Rhodomonas_salina.1